MRTPAPDVRPVALTVAGSDSGGGAGIQADLKTMEASGVFGTSVITSVTAQNTRGVSSIHPVPTEEVRAQYEAVTEDFEVGAAKTGMLGTAEMVETVTDCVAEAPFPVVVDPVMVATSGDRLLDRDAERAYEDLIAESAVVTPNADEAAVLTGTEPTDESAAREAGEALVEMGAEAALVKGGHAPGEEVVDVLVTEKSRVSFAHERVDTDATHGSGCTLSSAIAANLARGMDATAAVDSAVAFLQRAIRYPLDVGEGPGSVHHLAEMRDRAGRTETVEAVEGVVDKLVSAGARALVPEVGLNVVGATPYAERPDELAAVEGRIARTKSGVRPNRGVRVGASSHLSEFLLAVREVDSTARFAANCRFDDDVADAMDALGWSVARVESAGEDGDGGESVSRAAVRRAVEPPTETPAAVVDGGAVGREPLARVVAADADTLAGRLTSLAAELDSA
ncbi:bifunctional hydroxymethylpyrimidine kinase/phosphomethylpyrimidine kinase [Halopelagius longus]|uniref:Bifunctional hydroxymethylpyrimidine kinase/phosphomethylpyrimidine kinase n=1 Tax=Halopelagius longus TaxID=1236180 RepID=A0A1H1EVC7_9EURY|nr:bifunctional hydroxymethylpyrimidine kinase/phosphomethylpyrimidine kinase [Halopelagius longus]RDI71886.1 bifunctional hydroxymethylpyrimidine kinase/phosphomethylpyrimidine kinase [Halopelagius longus]SDQ92086.1 hydroxymethylpyrimidine/phosphomethylpyrimidine kinase [Halopelagius longus]